MSQVYSPLADAFLQGFHTVSALAEEQARLREIKKTRKLTSAQRLRLGQLGSDLDAISELFQVFSPRPWASSVANGVIENLHHASWWD